MQEKAMGDMIRWEDAIELAIKLAGSRWKESYIRKVYSDIPAEEYDEWCTGCSEYDTENHRCPRWGRVIRQAVEEIQVVNCVGCIHWIDGICDILKIPTEDFFYCGHGEREII